MRPCHGGVWYFELLSVRHSCFIISGMKIFNIIFLLSISLLCNAEYFENLEIKRVVDGDTVHTFYGDEIFKIRLTEIDAPERDQPFGKASTEYLNGLLKEGRVDVDISGTDKYGRKLGRLYWQGKDINREMVSAGYAWVYDKYVTDISFYEDQDNAKQSKKGLWKDSASLAPWEWRSLKK
jgi:micrococcal nuclease